MVNGDASDAWAVQVVGVVWVAAGVNWAQLFFLPSSFAILCFVGLHVCPDKLCLVGAMQCYLVAWELLVLVLV